VSGEAVAGSIIGFLRLDADSFFRTIEEAQAATDHLDGKDVNVRVKADTAGAETKLAAVAASEDKVDKGNVKVAKSGQQAGQGMGALVAALVLAGPAIVPLAAGAAGLAVGLGAMGAAGVLAVVGIMQEMKAGTALGGAYTAMVSTLKGDLTTLGHTAAAGVLGPFQMEVAGLQGTMPQLNSIIGEFSVITGKTAGLLTTGLVAAFISLEPLARDAGVYILSLSQRFAAMMSGPGVVTFGDYVRSVFPQVMQAVESIVTAALHLVAALAPLGLGTLGILRTFTDLINALPVDVLANLATVAGSVAIGFSVFKMLSVDMAGFGKALQKVGLSAETAATGVRALNIAAGVIGAILTVATFLYTAHAESVRQDQDAVNSLTDAMIRNKGAIDAGTVADQANKLAKDGTLQAAKEQGYALDDVTLASLGNAAATARVTAHTAELKAAWVATAGAGGDFTGTLQDAVPAVKKVTDATKDGVKQLDLAKAAYDAYNAATAKAATGGDAQAAAQQAIAAKIGTTAAALALATTGQQATALAAQNAAAKMYVENDAAGILKTSLDLLNGKALSAADAQNAFDASLVNMGDHVTATGSKVHFTTTSIKDMSAASVSLRGQLNGQVSNLQRVVEANGGLANSTGKARDQMIDMRKKIIDNAVAHDVNRAAVTAYIDKLLAIPKTVPPTKLDVAKTEAEKKIDDLQAKIDAIRQGKVPETNMGTQNALAKIVALQAQIDALRGKNIAINVNTHSYATGPGGSGGPVATSANGNIFAAFANGGIRSFANGGENHVAQIGNGITRVWNEPETGGEAYIPLAPSKRARSTAIWEETGKRLGVGSGGSSLVELGPNTIRALGREIAARPTVLDGAQVSRSVDSRLVPR